ncbi:MAG: hypothetical protein AAF411_05225 [Myxococcota bacterium]
MSEPTQPGTPPITATESLPLLPDVDRIFAAFVENANAVAGQARTALGAAPDSRDDYPSQKTVLAELVPLGPSEVTDPSFKAPQGLEEELIAAAEQPITTQGAVFSSRDVPDLTRDSDEMATRDVRSASSQSGEPGLHTQKNEAVRLVPDVASVRPPAPSSAKEASEDGQIPPRELERMMADMGVLLRYGHDEEVARRLVALRQSYPRDLLLLRRIAEFHLEMGSHDLARETLFQLASGLFQRKNIMGMRAALEQILVLTPNDARALKLVGLLDQR